jgi:hypothetical protein
MRLPLEARATSLVVIRSSMKSSFHRNLSDRLSLQDASPIHVQNVINLVLALT